MEFPNTIFGRISAALIGFYVLFFVVSLFFLFGIGLLMVLGISIVVGWILTLPSLIVSIVATVKEEGSKKAVPIANIAVTLLVFAVAMFAQFGFEFAP